MIGNTETDIKIGGDFNPVPEDKYTVQIADVELKTQFNKHKQEDQELLNYQFIILDDKEMEDGESTRDRYLWKRMTQIVSNKSWLGKFVTAVYGRDLTREELEAFANDPDSVIGKQVCVMTENNEGNNGTIYSNIISFSKALKELKPVEFTPKQSEREVTSRPVSAAVPNLNPTLDAFTEESEDAKDFEAFMGVDPKELAEFRKAKEAKAAKAKAKKKATKKK